MFQVQTTTLTEAGSILAPGTAETLAQQSAIAGLTGAADGTPASDAFEDVLNQWVTVLPQVAESNEMMASTVTTAGVAYDDSDNAAAASM